MRQNAVTGYVVSHFLGNQPLAWSFFVNGVAAYVLAVIAVVGLASAINLSVAVGLVFCICVIAWSLVGNTMAAIKALRASGGGYLKKAFAVAVIGAVVVSVGLMVSDLWMIADLGARLFS